jgi:hypothetical protein
MPFGQIQAYKCIKDWTAFHFNKLVAVLIVAPIFSAIILHRSISDGRLSACPKYDDVSYLVAGAARMREYLTGGLSSIINGWFTHVPHSPYSEGVSLLGFLLFGIEDWAPYIINTGFCFLFLWAILSCFGRINLIVSIAICIAASCIPLAGSGINEIRPDFMCSLLIATATLRTVSGRFFKRSNSFQIFTSTIFGAALLVKPTVAPSTLILQTACITVAIVAEFLSDTPVDLRKKIGGSLLRFYIPSILLALIYFIPGLKYIANYIYEVLFSSQKSAWMLGARYTKWDHIFYYLNGTGAQCMLGVFAMVSYLLLAAGLAAVASLGRKQWWVRYLSIMAPLVPMYLIITVTETKTQYFGLTFFIYLILAACFTVGKFVTFSTTLGARARKMTLAILVVLCFANVIAFRYPDICNDPDPKVRRREDVIVQELANIFEHARSDAPSVFFLTTGNINPEVVAYTVFKDGATMHGKFDGFTTDLSKLLNKIALNDFVVTSVDSTPNVAGFFPSTKLRNPCIDMLRKDSSYIELAQFSMPKGKYLLFQRLQPFCGFKPVSGMAESRVPREGNQDSQTAYVTNAPSAELAVYSTEEKRWKMLVHLKAGEKMQLTCKLDGKEIGLFNVQKDFSEQMIDFDLKPGLHKIFLSTKNAKLPITFKSLQIVPAHSVPN